jgi:hypothetical protein
VALRLGLFFGAAHAHFVEIGWQHHGKGGNVTFWAGHYYDDPNFYGGLI